MYNLHENGDTIERKTEAKRLVTAIDAVGLSSELGNESTLGGNSDGNVNGVAVDGEAVDIGGGKLNVEGQLPQSDWQWRPAARHPAQLCP